MPDMMPPRLLHSAVQHPAPTRRTALQAGAAGLLGLGIGELEELRAATTAHRARSVIYICAHSEDGTPPGSVGIFRYQDGRLAPLARVEARDRARIDRIAAGSAGGFWELVQEGRDDLRWCGASAFYTFVHAVRPVRGDLLLYEQWNIDEESVVSFAGLAFHEQTGRS